MLLENLFFFSARLLFFVIKNSLWKIIILFCRAPCRAYTIF